MSRTFSLFIDEFSKANKISRSQLFREAVERYLTHYSDDESLLEHLNPEEKQQLKGVIFDELNDLKAIFGKTIINMNSDLNVRLANIEYTLQKMIFLQYYLGRDVPQEFKEIRANMAKQNTAKMVQAIHREAV